LSLDFKVDRAAPFFVVSFRTWIISRVLNVSFRFSSQTLKGSPYPNKTLQSLSIAF